MPEIILLLYYNTTSSSCNYRKMLIVIVFTGMIYWYVKCATNCFIWFFARVTFPIYYQFFSPTRDGGSKVDAVGDGKNDIAYDFLFCIQYLWFYCYYLAKAGLIFQLIIAKLNQSIFRCIMNLIYLFTNLNLVIKSKHIS